MVPAIKRGTIEFNIHTGIKLHHAARTDLENGAITDRDVGG